MVCVSVTVALAIAELGLRVFTPVPQTVKVSKNKKPLYADPSYRAPLAVSLSDSTENGHVYIETPYGRRLRPNITATIDNNSLSGKRIILRTNSYGFRGEELGEKTKPRVLFLGDSVTFADYVTEDESFVRIVEKLSEKAKAPVETINAGIGSVGISTYLSVLKGSGLAIKPDVVVVNFYLNDFLPSPSAMATIRVPEVLEDIRLAHLFIRALSFVNVKGAERVLYKLKLLDLKIWEQDIRERFVNQETDERKKAFYELALRSVRDWGSAWSETAWNKMEVCFEEFKRLADVKGFKLLVVVHPVSYQVDAEFLENYPQTKMAALGEKLGFPVLDLLPKLREVRKAKTTALYYDQCHPTPFGNEIYADEIFQFLNRQMPRG